MQDATKTMLGTTESSDRVVSNYPADPASFLAGTAVRGKSDGGLSVAAADGQLVGVSLGRSLSDHKKTAVCRSGLRVPLLLTDEGVAAELEAGDLTFTAKAKGVAGNAITIALVDGGTAGSETVEVEGTDIVVNMDDGVSTAQQIADALEASEEAMALIDVAISGTAGTAQSAFAEDALEGGADSFPYVVKGAAVRVSDTTGKAVSSGGTVTGAVYSEGGVKTGVRADGVTAPVAMIDMGGGL